MILPATMLRVALAEDRKGVRLALEKRITCVPQTPCPPVPLSPVPPQHLNPKGVGTSSLSSVSAGSFSPYTPVTGTLPVRK